MILKAVEALILFTIIVSVRFGLPLPTETQPIQAVVTAYTCEDTQQNPMKCGAFRWEKDPNPLGLKIAACPVSWRGRVIYVNGEYRICKDTGRLDYIEGKVHIDILLDTYQEADDWGRPTLDIWYR